jgi:hypothetical protein
MRRHFIKQRKIRSFFPHRPILRQNFDPLFFSNRVEKSEILKTQKSTLPTAQCAQSVNGFSARQKVFLFISCEGFAIFPPQQYFIEIKKYRELTVLL